MTIQDAFDILNGADDAATQYLVRTTGGELRRQFLPIVSDTLQQTKATRYYGDIVNKYNQLPLVDDDKDWQDVNVNISRRDPNQNSDTAMNMLCTRYEHALYSLPRFFPQKTNPINHFFLLPLLSPFFKANFSKSIMTPWLWSSLALLLSWSLESFL